MEPRRDRPYAHLTDEELWAAGAASAARGRALDAEQIHLVAVLLWKTGDAKEDRETMMAQLMEGMKISRPEVKALVRKAELYLRENPPPSDARVD